MLTRGVVLGALLLAVPSSAASETTSTARSLLPELVEANEPPLGSARPSARDNASPRARWEHRQDGELWTRVALSAIQTHGRPLMETVPRDIAEWCPAYPENGAAERAAFWAGLLSTLARYESTWNPRAVGGNGRWFGLLQIYPPTAEFRNCRVQTGDGLKEASANLNCGVRIMATTVPRDNAISVQDTRWRGVAADWGPIRNAWMQKDMKRYTSRQTYCRRLSDVRPPRRALPADSEE